MIKWLIKCFFKSELETYKNQYLTESKKILEDTEKGILKKYIQFEYVDTKTEAFVCGMSPLFNNDNVRSWFLEKQESCDMIAKQAMKDNNPQNALNAVAQSSIIDSLISDIQECERQYSDIIAKRKLKGE